MSQHLFLFLLHIIIIRSYHNYSLTSHPSSGMDIHQTIDARAVLTLGKDMTFRDYAQGAFRMRGIGKGQTIELFIIPEVMQLIAEQRRRCTPQFVSNPVPQPVSVNPGLNNDLLSLSLVSPLQSPSFQNIINGTQLLVDTAAWLVVNGMRSENMQFKVLCHQSIDNVFRKRAFAILKDSYTELTQLAFADRAKEFLSQAAAAASQKASEVSASVWASFEGSESKLFGDNLNDIKSVYQAPVDPNRKTVGIPKIQRCLDILGERIDTSISNNVPIQRPFSETIQNNIDRHREFLKDDYDQAIVDKIILVLMNSENLAKREQMIEEDDAERNAEIQREEVVEEEVLQEEEEEEEEEVSDYWISLLAFQS